MISVMRKLVKSRRLRIKGVARSLPPTEDSKTQHTLHFTLQLARYHQATVGIQESDMWNQAEFGYEKEGGILKPRMMMQTPAPPEILNDLVCT